MKINTLNPRIRYKKETWTISKLADYAEHGRGRQWAKRTILRVLRNEISMGRALKLAKAPKEKRGPSKDIHFTGRPTEDYPQGRRYTPELIVTESGEAGRAVTLQTARNRIRAAIRDPSKEDALLNPSNHGIGGSHGKWEPEELDPEQLKDWRTMNAIAAKQESCNAWLYG